MAGVTGSDLKRRVTSIMAAPVGGRLGIAARVAFALAIATIVAVPVINGAAAVPQIASTITLPDPAKTFDAASVRQNKSGDGNSNGQTTADRVTFRNTSLKRLLLHAYPIQEAQLIGGPGWLDSDRFDVVAKAAAGTSQAELSAMFQNLLRERFAMKLHIETRSLPIYALTLARSDGQLGPNLHVAGCEGYSTGQGPCGTPGATGRGRSYTESRDGGGGGMSVGRAPGTGASMMMKGATMPSLANSLSAMLKRPVVDQTGLNGRFELELRYTMPGASTDSGSTQRAPELFTALQEQLGLKLEATRGPVEVLVIDSAEHPTNDDFEMPAQ
jgi:uncharacterized protein (TIGR03435 family)